MVGNYRFSDHLGVLGIYPSRFEDPFSLDEFPVRKKTGGQVATGSSLVHCRRVQQTSSISLAALASQVLLLTWAQNTIIHVSITIGLTAFLRVCRSWMVKRIVENKVVPIDQGIVRVIEGVELINAVFPADV